MAHQVVVLADELLVGESAGLHKGMVAMGDDAFAVGHRHQHSIGGIVVLALSHR